MITEDYVSFEIAKLLKEKGFDEFCKNAYISSEAWSEADYEPPYTNKSFNEYFEKDCCTKPTIQMAMKWLREKHNLHIITLPYAPIDRDPYHPGEADIVYIAQLFKGIIPIDKIGRSVIKLTHEQACEAAIKYCLENLI